MSHADVDSLLGALLPLAQKKIAEDGEFHPFGGAVRRDGDVVTIAHDPGSDRPTVQQVLDGLVHALRQDAAAGRLRAAGVCLGVRVVPPGATEKVHAIVARMEHEDGEAINVFMPYRREKGGAVEFGALFAGRGSRNIFVEDEA